MNQRYLIDTDILIDFFKARYSLDRKFKSVGLQNCFVSEISIAELTYGAFKSSNIKKQMANVEKIKTHFQIVPISSVIERYSRERLRLEKLGQRLPDFDLLIAATAVENGLTLVTGNENHHRRVQNIVVENWRTTNHNEFL
ncbi:MAG: PIN domain-containing protein [Chitinophagales bacterium]|nr:PIN domain-containing protein [Chitinophagales bacterium]